MITGIFAVARVRAQLLEGIQTIDHRHIAIQHDEIRQLLAREHQCIRAVPALTNGVAFVLKGNSQQLPEMSIVVYEQNSPRLSGGEALVSTSAGSAIRRPNNLESISASSG